MVARCSVTVMPDTFKGKPTSVEKVALGSECGRAKLKLPTGALSSMCYWHRIARTSTEAQIREAHKRRDAAQTPHRKRVAEMFWPPRERWCAGCQSFVPLWYCSGSRCRACASETRHEQHVEKTYGLGPEGYEQLFALQDGKCAICRKRQIDRRIAVDHDHKTGAVRGLLCKRCNHDLLGAAFDSIRILEAAVRYLKNPPATGRWVAPEDGDDD